MKKHILMVSPNVAGLGGISKVVAIWREADFFASYNVRYIPTTNETVKSKILVIILALCRFLFNLPRTNTVYIHCSSYNSFYRKSVFILLASLLGRKCILHIHAYEFSDFVLNLRELPRKYSLYVLNKVDIFVVLTEEMRGSISMLFPGKPMHVLINAVNILEMTKVREVQRANAELIYLGWYIREKGVYELVDAINILKGNGMAVHLNFFGTKEIEQLTEYVRKKNLTDMITVNGWINGEDKLRALHASTLLVLPSHYEGIPNVILESMATRTPIVATSIGGMKEILRDGENAVLAEVNNPVDLSEKILLLLQDEELRNRLAENAYREAVMKYDVPVIRNQFREIIDREPA